MNNFNIIEKFILKKLNHKISFNTKLLKSSSKKNKISYILVRQKTHKKTLLKKFVFAMGGLSSTYNLLKINRNLGFSLGKTYTEHPHLIIGYLNTKKNLKMFLRSKKNNIDMRTAIFHKKNRNINAFSITIDNNKFVFSRPALAFQYLLRLGLIPKQFFKNYKLKDFLWNSIKDLWEFFKIRITNKKIIVLRFEQELNNKSKLSLMNNLKISQNWCLSIKDYKLINYAANKFKKFVDDNELGEFNFNSEIKNISTLDPKKLSLLGIGHHMSTTRMSIARKKGIVSKNLKVNKINNLFICSSSVFPTVSSENPTYMISFLAIRLADYLNNLLKDKKKSL